MTTAEYTAHREAYIASASAEYGKLATKQFIKATDRKWAAEAILEYRQGQKIVVQEANNANLYAYSSSTNNFYLIASQPLQ
jgi:hypothetical protein